MTNRFTFALAVAAAFCFAAGADEYEDLVREEQQCLTVMATLSAAAIKADARLGTLNRQIKKHQQTIHLKVIGSPAAKELAKIEKTKPNDYALALAETRLKLLRDDPEMKIAAQEIRRLQEQMDRLLGQQPKIRELQQKLEAIRSKLTDQRR